MTAKMAKKAKTNIKLRNKIIEDHLFIIDLICKRYRYLPVDTHTIRYGAIIGLIRAIKTYNIKKGKFYNYAYYTAAQYAKTEASKNWPVTIYKVRLHKFLKLHEIPYQMIYLDSKHTTNTSGGNDMTQSIESVFPELIHYDKHKDVILKEFIENELNCLKPLEKEAILREYGNSGETLQTMGKRYGVTAERIRQISFEAFKTLSFRIKKQIKTYEG